MKPPRRSMGATFSPTQGTQNRSRSEILLRSAPNSGLSLGKIKDLRARRVYTPASVGICDGFDSTPPDERSAGSENKTAPPRDARMKLFWNTSSHCYRRLLPFLMDLTKDNSSTLEILSCQKDQLKAKKVRADVSSSSLSLMPDHQDGTDNPVEQDEVGDMDFSQAEHLEESPDPPHHPEYKTSILQATLSNDQHTGQVPMDLQESITDYSPQRSFCEYDLLCKSDSPLPVLREVLSFEELVGCTNNPSDLPDSPGTTNSDMQVAALTLQMAVNSHDGTFRSRVLGPTRCSSLAPLKGILKKRKGCRGMCTCLDCASFVLHADRAFGFSKKQMIEAEDVVVGLMEELSFLRKLVVDSVVPVMGGEGSAILQLNQVQDISRRASRAEESARFRMREMSTDLNIHCRTSYSPRPRVTFTQSVEERIMPASDQLK